MFRVSFSLIFIKYQSYLCWLVKFEHNFHLNFNLSFNLSESFLFSNISTKISDVRHITDNKRMQWTLLRNKFSVIEKNSLDNLSSRPWRHHWRVSLKAWLTSSDLSDERITHLPSILFTQQWLLKNYFLQGFLFLSPCKRLCLSVTDYIRCLHWSVLTLLY